VSPYTGYRDIYIIPRTPKPNLLPVAFDSTKKLITGFFGLGKTMYVPVRVELDRKIFIMGESIDNSGIKKKV
jgi:hypothetical protein